MVVMTNTMTKPRAASFARLQMLNLGFGFRVWGFRVWGLGFRLGLDLTYTVKRYNDFLQKGAQDQQLPRFQAIAVFGIQV